MPTRSGKEITFGLPGRFLRAMENIWLFGLPPSRAMFGWRNTFEAARVTITERERTTWFKIKNRNYSKMAGREKLFERDRHKEPVAGWHSCELACAGRTMNSQIEFVSGDNDIGWV